MRLGEDFFRRDCLEVAPALVGKILVHRLADGTELRERIAETEAYRGTEDLACHASKGKTPRNSILWAESGTVYVYLCYGMHHLLNVITGAEGEPQGVLLRAGVIHDGPGKLTKALQIDKRLNRSSFTNGGELWFEDDGTPCTAHTDVRVGIEYAGDYWKNKPWRWILDKDSLKTP